MYREGVSEIPPPSMAHSTSRLWEPHRMRETVRWYLLLACYLQFVSSRSLYNSSLSGIRRYNIRTHLAPSVSASKICCPATSNCSAFCVPQTPLAFRSWLPNPRNPGNKLAHKRSNLAVWPEVLLKGFGQDTLTFRLLFPWRLDMSLKIKFSSTARKTTP